MKLKQLLVNQVILFLLLFSCISTATPKTLTFSQSKLGSKFICAQQVLTQAYQQLGITVSFLTLPGKRSLKYSNSGEVDGEMLRMEGIETDYPNLLRVPIALCSLNFTVVANVEMNATSFSDLKGIDIGITRGYVNEERIAAKFDLNVIKVVRNEDLVNMLLKDRVKAIFTTELEAEKMSRAHEGNKFYKQDALTQNLFLYHYLHNKNEELLPLITLELRRLQKLGKIDLGLRAE